MTCTGAPTIRDALRAALYSAMKQRDPEATAVYRTALAAIDNAEAVPVGDAQRAGAIELSATGVGKTDVPRRRLSEEEMIQIIRSESLLLRDTALTLAEARPEVARGLQRDADRLEALLNGTTPRGRG